MSEIEKAALCAEVMQFQLIDVRPSGVFVKSADSPGLVKFDPANNAADLRALIERVGSELDIFIACERGRWTFGLDCLVAEECFTESADSLAAAAVDCIAAMVALMADPPTVGRAASSAGAMMADESRESLLQ